MTEPHDRETLAAAGETAAVEPEAAVTPRRRRSLIAVGLAGALLLVVAVAAVPFWAPLLPRSPPPGQTGATPVGNIGPVGAAPQEAQPQGGQQLAAEGRQQIQKEFAAANAALQLLDRRTRELEARPTVPASAIEDIRQQLARLESAAAELDAQVEAIGKAVSAAVAVETPPVVDPRDMALALTVLQIRGALEVGRPFAAEYEALAALAQARPAIAAAAAPLAEPAKTGLATRTVLAGRLRELAGAIAAKAQATRPEDALVPENSPVDAGDTAPDWVDQALLRLRGLVTIRRIDGTGERPLAGGPGTAVPETGAPEAAVQAADLALAGGDIEGALAALDKLTGAPEAAARPWLRMARERIAVEAALGRIEALMVARLGSPANAPTTVPAGAGSPR